LGVREYTKRYVESDSKRKKVKDLSEMKERRGWPLIVGVAILSSLCIAWAANQWQVHTLSGELDALAQAKIAEFRPSDKGLPTPIGRIAAEVVVSKPYVFFGLPVGKISVYVEHHVANSSPKVDGYEFYYARQPDATWTQTESGHCASEQCSIDGKRVLDAFGETL
jgi:hypothetical protein